MGPLSHARRGIDPPLPPHAATAWRLRRCHAESGLDRAGRRLCAGPHMIAGGLAHEAEGRGVLERKSASRRSVIACEAMKWRSSARIGVNSRDPDHRGDVGDNRPLITDPTEGLLSRGSQVRILPGVPFPKENSDFGSQKNRRRMFTEQSDQSGEFAPELPHSTFLAFPSFPRSRATRSSSAG